MGLARRILPLACFVAIGAVAVAGIAVAGSADRHLGPVHWSDPVAASAAARSLTVSADTRSIVDSSCGRLSGVPAVHETADRVTVAVSIVLHPGPVGVNCVDDPVSGIDVVVPLRAPLGHRRLVDATGGAAHTVLLADEAPALAAPPAGLTLRSTDWREQDGVVFRWWRNHAYQQVDLSEGPTAAVDRQTVRERTPGTPVRVGSAAARLWRTHEVDTVDTVVRWSPAPGRAAVLEVIDQSHDPFTADEVLALARGVR